MTMADPTTANPLSAYGPRLATLNQRLGAWQEQVAFAIREEFGRLQQAGAIRDVAQQQNAARMALARVGDGPRRELNGAVDELCLRYLNSDEAERGAIRELLQEHEYIFHDLWGYVRRAAEQVRGGGGEHWVRMGLAVVAIEDSMGDATDTMDGLQELYQAAQQQRVDAAKIFAECSAMASGVKHAEAQSSTREMLDEFCRRAGQAGGKPTKRA